MATEPTREQIDQWLEANCGKGLPHGEATDEAAMLHGLAYVLRQIEGTDSYRPHIGQFTSATSALRMALDRFATQSLRSQAGVSVKLIQEMREAILSMVYDDNGVWRAGVIGDMEAPEEVGLALSKAKSQQEGETE